MSAPLSLTLYDKDDHPVHTYTRDVIPWGLLKKAIRITDTLSDNPSQPRRRWFFDRRPEVALSKEEVQIDQIAQFVVELFGNRFTVRELDAGADLGEMMAVFQAVLARAKSVTLTNPTIPPRRTH
jgi:hypothetical protein